MRLTQPNKIGSALRSAVAYASVGLDVVIVVETQLNQAEHHKAIGTLRGMGARFVDAPVACDVEVSW